MTSECHRQLMSISKLLLIKRTQGTLCHRPTENFTLEHVNSEVLIDKLLSDRVVLTVWALLIPQGGACRDRNVRVGSSFLFVRQYRVFPLEAQLMAH